jgi:2-polyprenyl-3-methyl-5-hydroxy-6-metoxy-1,4-benzoquinol methylase
VYANLARRLIRAGLHRSSAILDHGCGSGLLVEFLRSRGFSNAVGYDSYSSRFNDSTVLERRYDCIVSQDVVEHVDDPRNLLCQYDAWARPGAIIAVGTPNAEAVNLADVERHVHTLHQPYHTHMFSKRALIAAGEALGWTLARFYPMSYVNTRIPYINIPFGLYYARCFDNTLNLAFEPIRPHPRLLTPWAIGLAFFGYYVCPDADVMALFQKPIDRQQ